MVLSLIGDNMLTNKIRIVAQNPISRHLVLLPLILLLSGIINGAVVYPSITDADAQNALTETDALVVMVNIERIRAQLLLTQKGLAEGNQDMAFAHAFIPHTATFPAIKNLLRDADEESATQLEALLTDLPIKIKTGEYSEASANEDIVVIHGLLDEFSRHAIGNELTADKGIVAQNVVFLLRDAVQSYQIANVAAENADGFSQVDYENALGLVEVAEANYQKISATLNQRRSNEIGSFFQELHNTLEKRNDLDTVSRLVAAIERDLAEELSLSTGSTNTGEQSQYFTSIRELLENVVNEIKQGNYDQADQHAITAYLDNYEYLEAPIEKHDPELMVAIEIEMREELREMIRDKEPPGAIEEHVNSILTKLDKAEELLANDPSFSQGGSGAPAGFADLEGLASGFGIYTGERREMGEAEDPAKAAVRGNIDRIRIQLDETLQLYSEGNYDSALLTSRSAYLDSYENIEIPLRPIDPDFTLEMEIKFAELRNLIQSHAHYEEVEEKVTEIKRGLDESERLVSGTGIIAPAIAFSTSFSIIFREGLESALIIGAILTYLEASRNDRFKKHVYYGIVIAVAATAVTWFIAEFIIEISGASRELIEAIAGVSAVAVLFWVSFWVLNKIETKRWIEFVKAKVWKATTTGSIMVFVMLSFFTVYREGFETVLFYQAMLSFAKYMEWYVAAGLVAGLAVIISTAFVVRKLGRRLPLRVLFALTMGIGAYMSIAFMGNAIREFQEVGYIPTTHLIGTVPRLDINTATMTGIHPTLETIVAQIGLLAVYVAGSLYVLLIHPRRLRLVEEARKSIADLSKDNEHRKGNNVG